MTTDSLVVVLVCFIDFMSCLRLVFLQPTRQNHNQKVGLENQN